MYSIETSIYTAVLITGLVLGSLLVYFAVTIARNQRRHFRMLSNHFLAEMERLEQERTRIARDLHDELGPILSVTQIHIDATTAEDKKGITHLEKARNNIQVLMERFSGIARNLTPRVLVLKGLKIALQDFFEQYKEVKPIEFHYQYKIRAKPDASISLHLYRMIQEMVHNAVKHSNATVIEVILTQYKKNIYIQCKDNGIGMNLQKTERINGGIGLGSLKARSEMLGGKLEVNSFHKTGTEYFIQIPLTKRNETSH